MADNPMADNPMDDNPIKTSEDRCIAQKAEHVRHISLSPSPSAAPSNMTITNSPSPFQISMEFTTPSPANHSPMIFCTPSTFNSSSSVFFKLASTPTNRKLAPLRKSNNNSPLRLQGIQSPGIHPSATSPAPTFPPSGREINSYSKPTISSPSRPDDNDIPRWATRAGSLTESSQPLIKLRTSKKRPNPSWYAKLQEEQDSYIMEGANTPRSEYPGADMQLLDESSDDNEREDDGSSADGDFSEDETDMEELSHEELVEKLSQARRELRFYAKDLVKLKEESRAWQDKLEEQTKRLMREMEMRDEEMRQIEAVQRSRVEELRWELEEKEARIGELEYGNEELKGRVCWDGL